MNSTLSRRKLISGTGALASALAAPALLLRPSSAAAQVTCSTFGSYQYNPAGVVINNFLGIPGATAAFRPMCGSDKTTERTQITAKRSAKSTYVQFTAVNKTRRLQKDIVELYRYSAPTWNLMYSITSSGMLMNGEHRILTTTATPWVLVGASVIATSSVAIQKWAGWKTFRKGTSPTQYAKYWIWDASGNGFAVKENVLRNADGSYNTANFSFHQNFTATCSLFNNKMSTLITAATAISAACLMALTTAIGLFFEERDADDNPATVLNISRWNVNVIVTAGVLGYLYYDTLMTTAGFAQTLFAMFVVAGYVV
jgi:hypothetical protein